MKLDFEKFLNNEGLKIGDRVKLAYNNEIYEIVKSDDGLFLKNIKYETVVLDIQFLNYDFEKVDSKKAKPKKVGDLICENTECDKCPLRCIRCNLGTSYTLSEILEASLKKYPQLEPMRDYLEQGLNKEVK